MSHVQLFGYPVGVYQIDADDPNLVALTDEIELEEGRSKGVALSNRGGWQSEKAFFDGGSKAFEPIKAKIFAAFQEFLVSVYGQRFATTSFVLETWANVNYRGHYNASHDHTAQDNHWSGILYLRTGNDSEPLSGVTVFENRILTGDGRYISTVPILENAVGTSGSMFELIPEPGKLAFFPGTLRHHVQTFNGSSKRITVAFNIRVKELSNYAFDQGSLKDRAMAYMRINFRGLILAGARLKRMLP